MKVIGIDPGLNNTGIAIIEKNVLEIQLLFCEEFKNKKLTFSFIFDTVISIIETYKPDKGAVESTFINCNPQSSIKLAKAQGVCLFALEKSGISFLEISPSNVKKTLTLKGNSNKAFVQQKIKEIFNLDLKENAADALAVALAFCCHDIKAFTFKSYK